MTKHHQPITSLLAHESVKESKAAMYVKIIEGLNKLRVGGTFDELSVVTGLKPQQIWKRYSEMAALGMIFNTGITRKGVSGRSCSVWQLTDLPPSIPQLKPKISITSETTFFMQASLF